jgi:aminoglycoside phosphotransferase family enzyme/predicted kinase
MKEAEMVHIDEQGDVLAFLTSPATHGGLKTPVRVVQTHISEVVLAGERAYKLKRAVRLPYVDFSTPERRLAACYRELELNRRTAPTIYRAVRRITRERDGRLAFDGAGALVDAVVEMNRFDEATLFDAMAQRHQLTPSLLTALAGTIARFHACAAVDHSGGGAANIAAVLDINRRSLAAAGIFDCGEVAAYDTMVTRAFAVHANRLDARERAGKVRRCHGDLHLRNICLVDGVPTLFDCIEFDDALATIDVLYDLAFVLMDLWHRDLATGANLVLNRYLDQSDETDGLPLLPFFMSLRAMVRAHVGATQADVQEGPQRQAAVEAARAYLRLARELLLPRPVRLVAIGGLSGTGKSTLAAAIADRIGVAPGARVISSDRIRKRIYGVSVETRLPLEAYAREVSEQVYHCAAEEVGRIVSGGNAAVAEAVFDRKEDRERIEQRARDAGVPFTGFWLEAPPEAMLGRVTARRGDASDATVDVVQAQLARDTGPIGWVRIDAGRPGWQVASEALETLKL